MPAQAERIQDKLARYEMRTLRSHATRHRACQGAALILTVLAAASGAYAAEIFHADFSKGSFKALGWKADGDWEVFDYNAEKNNPGSVARFPAHKPEAMLTKTFDEVKEPGKLELSLDVGWGDAGQGADAVEFLLLDAKGNVYACKVTESDTIYYCDNIEVGRHETLPVSKQKPIFFFINLATGGGWPVDLSRYGLADMYVDYVRVYEGKK